MRMRATIYIISLFLLSSMNANGRQPKFIKPKPLSIHKYPEVQTYLVNEIAGRNIEYLKGIARIEDVEFYDLGTKCNGNKLYLITTARLKIKDTHGEIHDISGGFCGSGGCHAIIFSMAGRKLNILFDDVLMDLYGSKTKNNCSDILVLRRHIKNDEGMVLENTKLIFKNGKYGHVEP